MSRTATSRWIATNEVLRRVSLLGLASAASGVVIGGIGGRIVMSISARAAGAEMLGRLTENGNRIGEFTVAGTVGLIVFGGLLGGLLAGVAVVVSDPWLDWLGPVKGLGLALAALTFFGYDTFASVDFLILDPPALNVGMFVGLILGFGFAVSGFYWLLDGWLPPARDREQPGYMVVVALGALPAMMATLFYTSSTFCGCDPAYEIGVAVLVMAASTAVRHSAGVTNSVPSWLNGLATVTGYVSLAVVIFWGLARTFDNLERIF